MHILKMKNILYKIKNTLDEFSRQDTTNTELVNLMTSQQKLFKSRHKEKKIKEEKEPSIRDMCHRNSLKTV